MQLSKYCKIFPSREDPASVLLFSPKNAAIVELPACMSADISSAGLSGKDRKTLKEFGFLVDPTEEKKEMLGFIDELNDLNKSLNLKLVMNLDCNLPCRYCFEGKRKGKHYMTRETADEFVGFVQRAINHSHPCPFPSRARVKKTTSVSSLSKRGQKGRFPTLKKGVEGGFFGDWGFFDDKGSFEEIHIIFYGGEPLLSKDLIIYIGEKIKSVAEDKGISFSFSFITNGTLLTKETVRRLKPLGLKDAYITIDGPEENHNKFRPYKAGGGSFDAILKNIRDVCDSTVIQFGGNFTRDNYKRSPELLDYLSRNDLPPSKASVLGFFPALIESADFGPEFHDGCASMNEPWLFEANLFLREEILKRGYRLANISPGPCAMEFENNILVNYDGSIYKCPGLIGRKEFRVGDLKTGIRDYRRSHNLDNWKNEECLDCEYLPLCFGGCRYMKLVRDGNMEGVDCKRQYLNATLETMIKQDIKYGLTA
jgi:uncharacterized protein